MPHVHGLGSLREPVPALCPRDVRLRLIPFKGRTSFLLLVLHEEVSLLLVMREEVSLLLVPREEASLSSSAAPAAVATTAAGPELSGP